jgi:hypothetical protein
LSELVDDVAMRVLVDRTAEDARGARHGQGTDLRAQLLAGPVALLLDLGCGNLDAIAFVAGPLSSASMICARDGGCSMIDAASALRAGRLK